MILNKQGIIVLGMHRGGTSLAAELVVRWGAYGSEGALQAADASNPQGYWEYSQLVSFNDELLRAVDSRWNVPPGDSDKALLEALAQQSDFRGRAIQLLQEMQTEGRPWFWKDPRLSILTPFWKQLWGPVVYIVAIRDPSDIAVSLEARDGFSTSTSFLLWQRYMSEILVDEEIWSTAFFISYELLLKNPIHECTRLCRFLDEQFDIQPSDRKAETMAAAINPELWRSRGCPFLDSPLATAAQRMVYQATLGRSADFTQECPQTSGLDALWREHLAMADQANAAGNRCQVFWRTPDGVYEERRSISALIKAGGELQSIHLVLPMKQVDGMIFLRIDFSQRPGLLRLMEINIRNSTGEVVWDWDGRSESIQDLSRNQIQLCADPMSERGCLLQLDGDDPWIEIALDVSQSNALMDGGTIIVAGIYLSTVKALSQITAKVVAELRDFESLTSRLRETENRLQGTTKQLEEILNSRTWRIFLRPLSISALALTRLRETLRRFKER